MYRWAVRLQDLEFTCKYLRGSLNTFADYMSRDGLDPEPIANHNPDIVTSYEHYMLRGGPDITL